MSILKNINYIRDLDRLPCAHPDIMLYIETAFKSAPPALLTLFQPGCTDILKTRIGNSPWHLRGISGLIKQAIQPYPISEQQFLYKIGYYAAEKYLWWWMVADVTTEFVTTWQSMIFQEQQCELPGAGSAFGYFEPVPIPGERSTGLVLHVLQGHPGVIMTTNGFRIQPGFQASIGWWADWQSWPHAGSEVFITTWMQKDGDPTPLQPVTTNDPIIKSGPQTAFHWFHDNPGAITPTTYQFYGRNAQEIPANPINSAWTISLMGRRQGNLTWGCTPKPVSWPFPSLT